MGDARFERPFRKVVDAADRAGALRVLRDDEVIAALAWAASRPADPYVANILATEALNRIQRLRLGLEYLAEGVVATDAEDRVTLANREVERKTGWAREDLMGKKFCEVLHATRADGSPLPDVECRIHRVRESGETDFIEEGDVFRKKDGVLFPVAYSVAPLILEGEIKGVVLVFRDVSRRAQESRSLRAREERLRRLTEASVEALVVHDGQRVLDANSAALRCFGYGRQELVGKAILELIAPASRPVVAAAVLEGRELRGEILCLRASGDAFAADVAVKNIAYDGKRVRVVSIRER